MSTDLEIPSLKILEILLTSLSQPGNAVKVIGIGPLAPVENSVSLKLMQHKTLNFVINLPDVKNLTK